ncbi:hypothetical protein [Amycolatopsis rifamycinica]|uniref:Lipocalin-like domain-containing protein n=1 Tax=Amycolatopsis rifamycinica TaxID=287986 RepID=A0A066U2G5_9PSEU|nr:hypothetical protein [Amycolatopsis rifamycinica]KDN18423.1 hypothetical protein DV20_31775 [Amycolatopsis rifamycinica]
MDPRLIGYWSDQEIYPGSPEYTDLGFRADGSGWMYWASWSTEFVVHRFGWRVPAPGVLVVRRRLTIGGTWSVDGPGVTHRPESREEADTVVELGWAVQPGPELILDRPLDDLLGGTRFRSVDEGGTDPTTAGPLP